MARVAGTLAPGSPPRQTMRTADSRKSTPISSATSARCARKEGVPMTAVVPKRMMVSIWRRLSPLPPGITRAPMAVAAAVAPSPPTNQA
jgi:hypothetical protein